MAQTIPRLLKNDKHPVNLKAMRIGVLTGGGDAPGLNPAIKGLVYRGSELGLQVIGLLDGWRSLINPAPEVLPLDRQKVRRWDRDGGTNLGSSRTNPLDRKSTRLNSSHSQ